MTTTVYPRQANAVRRSRPSGLDRAVLLLGLAMVRAARRHADRLEFSPEETFGHEEYRRALDAKSRYQQHDDRKALVGRPNF